MNSALSMGPIFRHSIGTFEKARSRYTEEILKKYEGYKNGNPAQLSAERLRLLDGLDSLASDPVLHQAVACIPRTPDGMA